MVLERKHTTAPLKWENYKLGEQSAEEPVTSGRSSPGQVRESRPLEVVGGLVGASRWRDVGTGSFHFVWREII